MVDERGDERLGYSSVLQTRAKEEKAMTLRQSDLASLELGLQRLLRQRTELAHQLELAAAVIPLEDFSENMLTIVDIYRLTKDLDSVIQKIFENEREIKGLK